MGNPYPDPELEKILSRKYQIAVLSWSDAPAAGVSIGTVDLMKKLVEIPNISDKLTQFRWLRADVDVEIRINATPFHIGALMVSYVPRCLSTSPLYLAKQANLAQKSQNSGHVISASTLNNITLHLDRQAPILMDNIDSADVYDGCLGQLDFTVLNKLLLANSGSVNPVQVSIFASFRNPKPSGYGYFPLTAPMLKRKINEIVKKQMSDPISSETQRKVASNSISSTLDSMGSFSSLLKSANSGDIIGEVSDLAQFALSFGLSKPATTALTQPVINDDFRDVNYAHGLNNALKAALRPEAKLSDTTVCCLKKNAIRDIISRPSWITTVVVTKDTNSDTPILHGPIGPGLSSKNGTTLQPTHLAYLSQSFRYWRGGMKLLFKFITSQFVTARFRITHWPAGTLPTSIEEYAGDAVSVIVDVRGDTDYELFVPYINPLPYLPVTGYYDIESAAGYHGYPADAQTSFITVSLVNELQQPDFGGDAVIYMNIFAAAGEDMTLGSYTAWGLRKSPISTVSVKKQSIEMAFKKPFRSIIPSVATNEAGLILPEKATHIEELVQKYDDFNGAGGPLDDSDFNRYYLAGNDSEIDPISRFGALFRWYRGSMRIKGIIFDAVTNSPNNRWLLAYFRDHTTQYVDDDVPPTYRFFTDRTVKTSLEYEVPWGFNTWALSYFASGIDIDSVWDIPWTIGVGYIDGTIPISGEVLRCAGDDWQYGYLLATPGILYPPPPLSDKGKTKEESLLPTNKIVVLDQRTTGSIIFDRLVGKRPA